ncbi:DEAD/DEAH box helicase [Demequina sp. NBRC 110055]|uniref:DEAD/DEAH box helicase n=1 Tax=Demequina sp. NBRC 110055 TaxID=1570344 RepID=UPI0009FDC27D|nr:DEAD/DEAH box helicase [Demequina sp. NBRC 110055]
MPSEVELTIGRVRNARNLDGSTFADLYAKLMTGARMADAEYIDILRFGIFMSRAQDPHVQRLGYRIFLQYAELTGDYEPLREIAQSRDLIPLVVAIERLHPSLADESSLSETLFAAHATNFEEQAGAQPIHRTRGQMELREFNARESAAIVVAPTSYGKSEMLIDKVAADLRRRTCVLVPSRALIAQTRASIVADYRVRASRVRVITHPDAFNNDERFIAILTQERLQRLLIENPALSIDQLLVDEAHNLLAGDTRGVDLSQAILIARSRSARMAITYYTPFIGAPGNLHHIGGADQATHAKTVNEHVKVEHYVIAPPGERHRLYDQFLNETFELENETPKDEIDAVLEAAGHRTLVYVNRPRDAQELAAQLATRRPTDSLSPRAARAIAAIGDLIDPRYALIDAIKHGVMFHHGQVPDSLRLYIEELFREDDSADARFLVTTSTLLEGVNTPADCLVMMTAAKGRANLSRSAFRNLVGRVGRFRELFSPKRHDLALLQPRIYLIPSSYSRKNWNVDSFLQKSANISAPIDDVVNNPLLEHAEDVSDRHTALEYLENIEPGVTTVVGARIATTEVGRLCFRHGVHDFDIFGAESLLQERLDARATDAPIDDVASLLDAIVDVFLDGVELNDAGELERIRDTAGARNFYAMFLDWRSRNEPFKRMIAHFVRYWANLTDEYVYVGQRWGEVQYGEGFRKLFVQMKSKTRAELVNLAVVKIKEEQDFVDFRLLKYVEVLFSLGRVSESMYFRIKYGTSDSYLICLLRNGFSPELARLTQGEYEDLVIVDVAENRVTVLPELPEAMTRDNRNDILSYEAKTLVNTGPDLDSYL